MAKAAKRTWDWLAIVAIVLAIAGLANYAIPRRTADYHNVVSVENPCVEGESGEYVTETVSDGTVQSFWRCYYTAPFSESSLPISSVLIVGSVILLVLRLRPIAPSQRRG